MSHVVARIKELALTPTETLEETVRTGDLQSLTQVMTNFRCNVSGAVVAAARSGRVDMLEILLAEKNRKLNDEECNYEHEEREDDEFLVEAATLAARRGCLEAVRLLHDSVYYYDSKNNSLWLVLEEAASRGHVDVVRYAGESLHDCDDDFIDCTTDRSWETCRALALAISGGHVDVVEF
ncbi:unnamed protein product [Phytophthora fragariaefolia]|uniref:Unnamed protein product n=1 Tax=Phytophthora fragariaefolia TaxID=1490495 RepID=A0A9W7D8B2_9STRA|nr:unnamed protein product [Phytophthora fragariaefolia]